MLKTKLRRTSLIALAVVLMLSVFSMTAFAEEEVVVATTEGDMILISPNPNATEGMDGAIADTTAADVTEEVDGAEETVEETEEIKETEEIAGEGSSEGESVPTTGTTNKPLDMGTLISLIILGVVIVAVVVYCIVKREKVGKFFRGLKSEFKKIVWSPWEQVRKNTIVVVVIVVAVAILIGLLDTIFHEALVALGKLS